ncbi:hypothetical protein ACSXEQ_06055 [Clostridium perfringens]
MEKTIQNSPSDRVSENYLMFHMENSKEPVDSTKILKRYSCKRII